MGPLPLPDKGLAKWLAFLLNLTASVVLFLLMVVTCVDVFGRYVFSLPLSGSIELTEMALGILVFSVFPVNAWRNEHIVVDILDRYTPPVVHLVRTVALNVVAAIALYFVGKRILTLGNRSLSYGEESEYLAIPLGWTINFIGLMCWLSAIALLTLGIVKAIEHYRHHDVSVGTLYR
ncbi:MAG: TRAP transporter small permease [Proteobacteria bacterium]|nr:TRAP transporter small permease [Pseudomonadota bacterium]